MNNEMTRKEAFFLPAFGNGFAPIDLRLFLNGAIDAHIVLELPIPQQVRGAVTDLSKGFEPALLACFLCSSRILVGQYFGLTDAVLLAPATKAVNPARSGNMLYLRSDLWQHATMRALLNAELKNISTAITHQDYDAHLLAERVLLNYKVSLPQVEGISLALDHWQSEVVQPRGNSILIRLYTANPENWLLKVSFPQQLNKAFVGHFIDHLLSLTGNLSAILDKPPGEVEILSLKERDALVGKSQVRKLSPGQTLTAVFRRNVLTHPSAKAVAQGNRSMSYKELDQLANRLAAALKAQGVEKGDIVAILMPSCFGMVASQLAVWKCGAIILFIDKITPEERITSILHNSGARVLLTAGETGPERTCPVIDIDGLQSQTEAATISMEDPETMDPAYLFYTSGSTGNPKAVILTHHNICAQFDWMTRYFNTQPQDVIPQKSSVNFIDSILEMAYPVTFGRGAVYLRPYDQIVFEAPAVQAAWFKEIGASWMIIVPSLLDKLASVLESIPSLRHLCVGGEELTRTYAGHFTLYHVYGLSECSCINTIHVVDRKHTPRKIPIGVPIDNTYVYLLDEQGRIVPPFVPGHVHIGGDGVGAGFRDEQGANGFVPDPFNPGERIYYTGDLACWNEKGELIYVGRKDRQVKIRGVRIDLNEIELALSGHPGLEAAAVIVRSNNGVQQIIAWAAPENDTPPAEMDLKTYLNKRLPPQAIPSHIIMLPELPQTITGKINRVALAKLNIDDLREEQVMQEPENDTQAVLATIWKAVLNLKKVGIRNNYFELGGHSLNLMVTIAEINKRFSSNLRADDLIRYPTIEKLGAFLDGNTSQTGIHSTVDPNLLALNEQVAGLDNLVMLPPFAGISYGYRKMGQYLQGKVNLYGINAKGMFDPSAPLPRSFDEIATDYNRMVKDHITRGGLYIGGYSASVPIAFEMVKKMEQEGLAIKKLFLVDDFFKAATVKITDAQRREMERRELVWALKTFFNVDMEGADYSERWFEERLDKLGGDEAMLGGFRIAEVKRFKEVILNLFDCLLRYQPAGKVATDIVYFYTDHYKIDYSWQAYARQGFSCEFVHGLHGTIFLPGQIEKNSAIFLRQFASAAILQN